MKKIWNAVKHDLWVVLFDAIVVNAAYYMALVIRFYVNFEFRPKVYQLYLPGWIEFTPWYTLICLLVFFAFHLYGGVWRYAGINTMNRIISANVVTSLVHIIGTLAFVCRMPITYYAIGAALQFVGVAVIRFAYRILLAEKKNINMWRNKRMDTVVVGSGENGRRVVKILEESELYRPIAVIGPANGVMDGLPIVTLADMPDAQAIFIADPLLSSEDRRKIKEIANATQIEFHEYTGFFSNLGGRLSLTELLATIHTPVTLVIDGKEKTFQCGEDALRVLTEKYAVTEVCGNELKLYLKSQKKPSAKEALEQAYAAVMGEDKQ